MFGELCSTNVDFRGDLVRNIKTIRHVQDLFDDLSSNPDDWAVAITAEGESSRVPGSAIIERPFDYGTVIGYSFDSATWQATRFSDSRRYGVWYGSLEAETTVYETACHWNRFLEDSFPELGREVLGERRLFDVRCEALLIDLRDRHEAWPDLVNRTDYRFTQSLGSYLKDEGANGLLVKSARCDGINAAVLRAERLSNVRDKMFLTYRRNPGGTTCDVFRGEDPWMSINLAELG